MMRPSISRRVTTSASRPGGQDVLLAFRLQSEGRQQRLPITSACLRSSASAKLVVSAGCATALPTCCIPILKMTAGVNTAPYAGSASSPG